MSEDTEGIIPDHIMGDRGGCGISGGSCPASNAYWTGSMGSDGLHLSCSKRNSFTSGFTARYCSENDKFHAKKVVLGLLT